MTDSLKNTIMVDGVELTCIPDAYKFIVPDCKKLLEFYPEYFRMVNTRRETPKTVNAYFIAAVTVLGTVSPDMWLHKAFEYFGLEWFEQYNVKYRPYTDEIRRMEAR